MYRVHFTNTINMNHKGIYCFKNKGQIDNSDKYATDSHHKSAKHKRKNRESNDEKSNDEESTDNELNEDDYSEDANEYNHDKKDVNVKINYYVLCNIMNEIIYIYIYIFRCY